MQQHRRQQAEDGEAEEHDYFGDVGISRRSNQGGECADIPQKRQACGRERQPAPAQARAGTIAQQQVQENAEDDCAGRVADGVNELSFVERGQFAGFASSVLRLFRYSVSVLYPVIPSGTGDGN